MVLYFDRLLSRKVIKPTDKKDYFDALFISLESRDFETRWFSRDSFQNRKLQQNYFHGGELFMIENYMFEKCQTSRERPKSVPYLRLKI